MTTITMTDPETLRTIAPSLPDDKELVLRVIPMPGDTNSNGDIFGGWVMAKSIWPDPFCPLAGPKVVWRPWR